METSGEAIFTEYLDKHDERFKPGLIALRKLILAVIPNAEETFSYQVHCFKHIYKLVGIGTTKEFCSLYTMSPSLIKKMKDDLKGYKTAGTTIHFKPGEALHEALITKIVEFRLKEDLAKGKKESK